MFRSLPITRPPVLTTRRVGCATVHFMIEVQIPVPNFGTGAVTVAAAANALLAVPAAGREPAANTQLPVPMVGTSDRSETASW